MLRLLDFFPSHYAHTSSGCACRAGIGSPSLCHAGQPRAGAVQLFGSSLNIGSLINTEIQNKLSQHQQQMQVHRRLLVTKIHCS